MRKLYCYVDETGQDARSEIFIISVALFGEERDQALTLLESIERQSKKGRVKWIAAKDTARVTYVRSVLGNSFFKGKLHYAVYPPTKDYVSKVVLTTARAITLYAGSDEYRATVIVDGLQKPQAQRFGNLLHDLDIKTRKVRGAKDETNALIRLPDAVSGFVRAALEGRGELRRLLDQARKDGIIREL